MQYPISAELQKAYRDTLDIPSAPGFIDTSREIVPVAIVAQATSSDTVLNVTDGPVSCKSGQASVAISGAGSGTLSYLFPAGKQYRIEQVQATRSGNYSFTSQAYLSDPSADINITTAGTAATSWFGNLSKDFYVTGGSTYIKFDYTISAYVGAGTLYFTFWYCELR